MKNFDEMTAKIAELEERLTLLETKKATKGERDYGPDSTRKMDTMAALRILVGRWSGETVRAIADNHGFSRGQVYSLKGEYTMKEAHKTANAIRARRAARLLEA